MTSADWAKSLDFALTDFVVEYAKTPWTLSDIKKIKDVVKEIGLEKCKFASNSSHVFDVDKQRIWMKGQGKLHIHPTMLVSEVPFSGSTQRELNTNATHPFFFPLTNYVEKSSPRTSQINQSQVLCPKLMLRVPSGHECMCGEIHAKP
jgi:hypothetical protein